MNPTSDKLRSEANPLLESDPQQAAKTLVELLDSFSLEAVVELKVSRFLDQIGTFYPDNLFELIMKKVERPLLHQLLLRVGGNQVHAARILGINRNTLRKKLRELGLDSRA